MGTYTDDQVRNSIQGVKVEGSATVAATTYTVIDTVSIVNVGHTATAAVTVTLSSAEIAKVGRKFIIVDTGDNAGTNNITVATEDSETIGGSATGSISADSGTLNLVSDGSNLFIL